MKTPDHKVKIQAKLLIYARELETQGFTAFEISLTETDGSRWKVTDTINSQPKVEYLGNDDTK